MPPRPSTVPARTKDLRSSEKPSKAASVVGIHCRTSRPPSAATASKSSPPGARASVRPQVPRPSSAPRAVPRPSSAPPPASEHDPRSTGVRTKTPLTPAGLNTQDLIAYLSTLPVDERAQILAAMMAPPAVPVEAVPVAPSAPASSPSIAPHPSPAAVSVAPIVAVAPSAPVTLPPVRPMEPSCIDLDIEVELEQHGATVAPLRSSPPPAPSVSRPPPPPASRPQPLSTLPAPASLTPAPVPVAPLRVAPAPLSTMPAPASIPPSAVAPIGARTAMLPAEEARLPGELITDAPLDAAPPLPPTPFPPAPASFPPPAVSAPPAPVALFEPPIAAAPAPAPIPVPVVFAAPVEFSVSQPFPLTQVAPPSSRPQSAIDVLDLLFDAMQDLPFLETALEASAFCLASALRVLPSRAGMVHLYDINTREFITVYAQGEHTEKLLMTRTPETCPLLSAALKKRRAMSVRYDRGGSPQVRHAFYGPPRSVLIAPAMVDGRYLAVIELIDPMQDGVFDERAENAISYVADRFAEFLAQHGVGIGQIVEPETGLAVTDYRKAV